MAAKQPTANQKNRKYKCDVSGCEWSFDERGKLLRHLDTHISYGRFCCLLCKEEFIHEYNIYPHWRKVCASMQSTFGNGELLHVSTEELNKKATALIKTIEDKVDYYEVGAVSFRPSKDYIIDVSENSELSFYATCYLCGLSLPAKFIRAHIDAHRGHYAIDEDAFQRFMCNLCSLTFSAVEQLYKHWYETCEEVEANHDDVRSLTSDELLGLVYSILQQSVPLSTCERMRRHDINVTARFWRTDVKSSNAPNIKYLRYQHSVYPWPSTNVTFYEASEQISMNGEFELKRKSYDANFNRVNLLADMCPSFYAMYAYWLNVRIPDDTHPNPICRLLTYENTPYNKRLSSMSMTSRSYPQINKSFPMYRKWNPHYGDVSCNICRTVFANRGRLKQHKRVMHEAMLGLCVLCAEQLSSYCSLVDHWRFECPTIDGLLSEEEKRNASAGLLRELIYRLNEGNLMRSENEPLDETLWKLKSRYFLTTNAAPVVLKTELKAFVEHRIRAFQGMLALENNQQDEPRETEVIREFFERQDQRQRRHERRDDATMSDGDDGDGDGDRDKNVASTSSGEMANAGLPMKWARHRRHSWHRRNTDGHAIEGDEGRSQSGVEDRELIPPNDSIPQYLNSEASDDVVVMADASTKSDRKATKRSRNRRGASRRHKSSEDRVDVDVDDDFGNIREIASDHVIAQGSKMRERFESRYAMLESTEPMLYTTIQRKKNHTTNWANDRCIIYDNALIDLRNFLPLEISCAVCYTADGEAVIGGWCEEFRFRNMAFAERGHPEKRASNRIDYQRTSEF
ncbi:unnamed protein product [Caenorhabditis bovis]|uniref:C2H2-type domain-containing protein n=1 Tax=Caenorhabditis bovis TaxID=2654633 RepID=A0A8S1F7J2_9PELO|nr:unnamed protein product [Caenorhabditis bovis]